MLIQQQFKDKDAKITLTRDETTAKIGVFLSAELANEDTAGQIIELPVNIMRRLVRILRDSPFIFSEENNK